MNPDRTTPPTATIRSLGPTVYAPSLLFAVGQGAVLPIVALAAVEVGASAALAGFIVALRGIGTMVFDVPAGALIGRLGERVAMLVATVVLVLSLIGCVLATSPVPFAVSMFLMGCGWATWMLARLTYVSDVMPLHLRGRALSTLGGVHRIGNFLGPFLGAVAVTAVGLDGAYLVHVVLAVVGWLVLVAVRDPHGHRAVAGHGPVHLGPIVRRHASVFATAGVGAMCLSALRSSRHAVLPLWGAHIGLDAAAIAIVFGVTSGLDMLLFYPAGAVSDRFGRKVVAVPCLVVLALGFVVLPLTDSFATLAAAGLVMGFGNGLGSGIVMTLGADFSPPVGRAAFLGVWRTISDAGAAGGPLLASAVIGVATIGAASVAVGAVGLAGAVVIARLVPEPLHRARTAEGGAEPAPSG